MKEMKEEEDEEGEEEEEGEMWARARRGGSGERQNQGMRARGERVQKRN